MPTYIYTVLDGDNRPTDETVERHFKVDEKPERITLDDGRSAEYDFARTIQGVTGPPPSTWPRTSHSLGINKNQVAKFRQKYPHHGYNDDGTVTLKSPSHARQVCKDRGAVDNN